MGLSPLIAERIGSLEQLREIEPEWERLAARIAPRLPFHEPRWHLRWFEHLAHDGPAVRDRLAMRALRRPGGELVALAPFMITERPARGPLRVRTLQCVGTDPNITELRGVICAPEDEADVFRTLLGELRHERASWDFARWTGLRRGGAGEAMLLAEPGVTAGLDIPDYVLDLPPTWEDFRAGLSRNIKESLRKCTNAPKRDGLTFTPRVVEDPAGLQQGLDAFFALHSQRASAADTVRHNDAFAAPDARAFLRALAADRDGSLRLRIYQLRHGERVIATRVAFVLGDALYLYYSGYDLEYGKYSVMTTCVAEAIRHAIESGLKTVNLSVGNDVSKTRWGPRELTFGSAVWVSPSARGRVTHELYAALERTAADPPAALRPLFALLKRSR